MRVALVHELLTMKGGAERVLRILADMFADAPIYTFLYDEKKLGDWFPKERIRTSNKEPATSNHHLLLSRFPRMAESWDFSQFDLVLSTSSAFAHGIITNGKPKHLCYVHSPARYLWDRTHDVQERAGKGPLGPFKRAYLSRVFHKLRVWDAESAPRADRLLAASKEVQRRIERYWRLPSKVLYPPIDDLWLAEPATSNQQREHFLIVSTLASYKRIDLAIDACNKERLPLLIVGDGPERKHLEALAGPTIQFLGYKDHDELRALYASARATIVPGEEDFGLVPIESLACGTPVIAYGKGGVTETVEDGKTGVFFLDPTAESLAAVLRAFDPARFAPAICRATAERHSRTAFESALRARITALCTPVAA